MFGVRRGMYRVVEVGEGIRGQIEEGLECQAEELGFYSLDCGKQRF